MFENVETNVLSNTQIPAQAITYGQSAKKLLKAFISLLFVKKNLILNLNQNEDARFNAIVGMLFSNF